MLKLENVKWTAEDGSEILKGIDFEAKEGTKLSSRDWI